MLAKEVLRTLKHIWVSLEALDIPMAVMGGIALSVWKHTRATQDVDLLVDFAKKDENLILQKLFAAKRRFRC
jgi:hypothetical protein